VKINEITINGDANPGNASAPITTTSNVNTAVRAVITVSNLGTQADVKLSLRSTASSLDVVKSVWTGKPVLQGSALSAADVGKFTLKEFKCYSGTPTNQAIDTTEATGYKIYDNGIFDKITK